MSKAEILAGRAYVSIHAKSSLTKDLSKAKQELNDFGSSIMGIGAKVAGMGALISGGMTAAMMHFVNVGSELNDLSARTGISTTALAELGYAAKLTGGDMGTVESGIKKMQKGLGEIGPESKKVAAALGEIGLSAEQLSGIAPEDQFQMIAEGIAGITDPTKQAAAAMALFGGSGTELLPMIKDIKALRQEAKDLGIAPSPESIAAADALGDAIDRVKAVVSATVFEIGAAIAPMRMQLLNTFLTAAKAVKKFVSENKPLVVIVAKVGTALMIAGGAIMAVGAAFIGIGMAIGGALSVMSAIGAVIGAVLSPIGLLAAALIAGVYAWARFTESGRNAVNFITQTFGGMLTTVKDTFGGIVAAIQAGDLTLAGQIAMVGLRLVFAQGMEGIHALFGETIGTLVGQLLSGDLSGAWATMGSLILDSVAQIAAGIVGMFTGAADAVMNKWQQTVNKISDFILEAASEGGAMGWALEQVSGVNMQEEVARGKRIEAQRLAAGMNPDGSSIVDSTQFQHPGLAAMKEAVANAGKAANAGMGAATDSTGKAVADATDGKAAAASAEVTALQAELAALRKQAADKVNEINAGKADRMGSAAGAFSGAGGGTSSAASFNLGSLYGGAGGIAQKQLSETQKAVKLHGETFIVNKQMLKAIEDIGGRHS